jgi:hypothetical protein
MELTGAMPDADSTVVLRMEVEAAEVITTALDLLMRDALALATGRFGDDPDDRHNYEAVAAAATSLEYALECYYGVPM